MTLPEKMKALVFHKKGDEEVKVIPVPQLRRGYMLVKVECVALNPTDWKHITWGQGATPFSIVGCDYAGTVVAIGEGVIKSFKVGDRVFGCAHGSNESNGEDGCFAEYACVKGDVAMHAPSGCEMEDLATLGLGSITVGQGLFQPGEGKSLGLKSPETGGGNGEWVFISGGSTATGSLGIQLAKMAGYRVVVTCSPKNFEFVKERGADEVVDYRAGNAECGRNIRELTGNKLRYAWDTIGEWEVCEAALSDDPSLERYMGTILGNEEDFPKSWDVKISSTSMYTVFGEGFRKYEEECEAKPEDFEFGKEWMGNVERWVREGKLRCHPKEVREGGLEGILSGLEDLKEERVSRAKLVYRISSP